MPAILSIQSHVAYGHVGNRAAVFPLQRLGHEVWAVNTVQFSNHTGYGAWTGEVFSPAHIRAVIAGIAERGVLDQCAAVLSGYVGAAALGGVILEAVAQVRAANPAALFCCDPVMGDVGRGFFVRPGIPEFMREEAVPAADIVTPNLFELQALTGLPVEGEAALLAAVAALRARGPRIVLVTSVPAGPRPEDGIAVLAADAAGAWLVATPHLPLEPAPNGAGDCIAALFLAALLQGRPLANALEDAASAIFHVLEVTRQAGTRELQLVAAQDGLAAPPRRFTARRLA